MKKIAKRFAGKEKCINFALAIQRKACWCGSSAG